MKLWSQVLENAAWFVVSLFLAFTIWYVANIQSDPIQQQAFRAIPVQIVPDAALILANNPTDSVQVNVRAQRSVLQALTRDDITVTAEVTNRGAGTHTVPLLVRVNRSGVITTDTQPTQITVVLDEALAQQKPVRLRVAQPPPVDYSYDAPVSDVLQVEVRGAVALVESVVEVRGDLDLSQQRGPYNTTLTLVPVDANGLRVPDVTLTPATAPVTVTLYARPDVRQVTVRPNILFETLTEGYVFQSVRTDPQIVYLSGRPADLARVGETINTAPIDLTGRTDSFTVETALQLPFDDILVLNTGSTVRVEIGLSAQIIARQIDGIHVETIGTSETLIAALNPPNVSAIITGPLDTIQALGPADVQALIDLNGLPAGTHILTPQIIVQQGRLTPTSAQVIPTTITVTLTEQQATSEP